MKTRLQRTVALMLICLLSLSGCSGGAQVVTDEMERALPDPPTIEDAQILGDVRDPYTRDVTLYYAVENSLDLTGITRAIEVGQNETLIDRTLDELLRTLSSTGALRTVASSEQLIDLEYSCGVASVNLTLEAGARQSDQDGLLLCAAIADTLLGLEGVEAVNILAGGRNGGVGPLGPEPVQHRRLGNMDGVVAVGNTQAKSIHDYHSQGTLNHLLTPGALPQ